MEAEIIKMVITQGIFAVLFVWLFFDTRKDSKQREEKYISTLMAETFPEYFKED